LTDVCATSAVTSSVPNHAIYQAKHRLDKPLHISTRVASAPSLRCFYTSTAWLAQV